LTFVANWIPIVSHGTPENFITTRTTIKILLSAAHRQNDNFQYITRFRKKKPSDQAQKTTRVHQKKSGLSLAIDDKAKKYNIFYGCFVAHKNHIFVFFLFIEIG
jgi:hypothetical protein